MRALVRWAKGYFYRGGSVGDEHVFSSKTDYTVLSTVHQVIDAELAEATDDSSTVALAARIRPRNGDDEVYEHLNLGDAAQLPDIDGDLQPYRTVTIKVRESQLCVPDFGLEVNSRLEDEVARQRRWLEAATPAALAGRAAAVSSTDLGAGIPFGELRTWEVGTYQQSGYLVAEIDPDDPEDDGHSDAWPVDEPTLIYRIRWALKQAGDTATVVHMRCNGGGPFSAGGSSFFHAITIPAGATAPDDDTNAGMFTNFTAAKGDVISAATYQAGSYARGLVVRVKGTTQT